MSLLNKKKPIYTEAISEVNKTYGELLNSVNRLSSGQRNSSVVEKTVIYTLFGEKITEIRRIPYSLSQEIQAENQRAAESRVSDVDTASLLTNKLQNLISYKALTAVYAHGNIAPQMVLRLLG